MQRHTSHMKHLSIALLTVSQMMFAWQYKVTLVALIWTIAIVCFQMSPLCIFMCVFKFSICFHAYLQTQHAKHMLFSLSTMHTHINWIRKITPAVVALHCIFIDFSLKWVMIFYLHYFTLHYAYNAQLIHYLLLGHPDTHCWCWQQHLCAHFHFGQEHCQNWQHQQE